MEDVKHPLGNGNVAQEFLISEKNIKVPVAGCHVNSGTFSIEKLFQVSREKTVIYDGPLSSLKYLKEEKPVVAQGKDCGIMLEDKSIRFKPGDVITCYEIRQEKRTVTWSPGF